MTARTLRLPFHLVAEIVTSEDDRPDPPQVRLARPQLRSVPQWWWALGHPSACACERCADADAVLEEEWLKW